MLLWDKDRRMMSYPWKHEPLSALSRPTEGKPSTESKTIKFDSIGTMAIEDNRLCRWSRFFFLSKQSMAMVVKRLMKL
jgi:hypothetical protein